MGESFNTVRPIEPPFDYVDERVIFIPRGRRLEVGNVDLKFLFFFAGDTDLKVDGQELGPVRKGDILIVPRPCRQLYTPRNRRAEERLHVMRLFFDPATLRDGADKGFDAGRPGPDPETDFPAFVRKQFKFVRVIPGGLSGRLLELALAIRETTEKAGPGHRFRVSAYCRLIVVEIVRLLDGAEKQRGHPDSPPGNTQSWAIEHTKQFLFENHARSLTLSEIAWEVKLSGEHLCRCFKEETGITVFAYLRNLRIDAAKGLLTSSKLKITEIAERCGFGSSSVFSRTFQKAVGSTPVDFRREATRRIVFQTTTLEESARLH